MLKQFEIHGGVVKNLNAFLAERGIDLKTAMDAEETNKLVAAIIHEGLPGMVRRIYSLQKMQTFFWEKKDLMVDYVAARLEAAEKRLRRANKPALNPVWRPSENPKCGFQTASLRVGTGCRRVAFC